MTQSNRLNGGQIDRAQSLRFTFDGQSYSGHAGDTLASALLANGVRLMGRSFKYHRPRGPISVGSEEPNALMMIGDGARVEPNTRATVAELYDGLTAQSQNAWPSLKMDALGINDVFSNFLTAGFYYKTFMWPRAFWEKLYEPAIRKAAGLGSLSMQEDPDCYDKGFLHCDLLVIGAGPSGLMAALTAARAGARVILADEDFLPGGRLNAETHEVGGMAGADWAALAVAELAALPNVRLMTRTTVWGAYDHGIYGALERRTDHLADSGGKPRQVQWRIYSKRAVLAAGATERPIAFGMNDRPGIMMAGAMRAYVNRWGVAPGCNVAVFTNNDDGWRTAADLTACGANIACVIDPRDRDAPLDLPNVRHARGTAVMSTVGRKRVHAVTLTNGQTIPVDALAVSGGWNPNVHLTCHQRGRPVWHDDIAAFVPGGTMPVGMTVAGAANGSLTLSAALAEGRRVAGAVLEDLGRNIPLLDPLKASDEPSEGAAFWHVCGSKGRAWVDLQNDVTVKDIRQSHREGFRSVEHLKRYTTLGMATDQGKTSNVTGLALMARERKLSIPEVGTTIFRPPYTPVPLGALAGRSRGKHFRPTRRTPSHNWAATHGASFVETGAWLRAEWYARPGERGWRDSVDREVQAVRKAVGICDVSTLGKIDIQGRDAAEFLNRVYSNGFGALPVGKTRYGLMLREDGIAYDDGTTARLGDTHFLMTTTTANAVTVFRRIEFARQCLWPDLDVHLISVTDAWAQFSVAGPKSRALMEKVVDGLDLSNDAFPFMGCTPCTVFGGTPARLFRISFSGELAYEIAVPARFGNSMMAAMLEAGHEFDAIPYGTEALGVMRIEKGHAAGNELNGQTTALNLGLDRMVSRKKDAIGTVLDQRPDMASDDANRLMGFRPVNPADKLIAGAHFIAAGDPVDTAHDQGWMTSVAFSPELGHSIGLGFLKGGQDRVGEVLRMVSPIHGVAIDVEVTSPHHIDPEGVRQRG